MVKRDVDGWVQRFAIESANHGSEHQELLFVAFGYLGGCHVGGARARGQQQEHIGEQTRADLGPDLFILISHSLECESL